MTAATRAVLLGSSGVLGSGFRTVFDRFATPVIRLSPDWRRPGDAAALLHSELPALVEHDGPTTIVWAAGSGSVGASVEAMAEESANVSALATALGRCSSSACERVTLVFASSAGALFGGHGDALVDEGSEPRPITPYGQQKLAQEVLLARTAHDTGVRVLLCRYTNLYGLADGLLTRRGFVSTAVRASRLRQPMTIFVSPDTRRDLVLNTDAAACSLALAELGWTGVRTALVQAGTTQTISELLAVVGHVSGRRVPATYAERPETRLQPRVLRFTRPSRTLEIRRTPFEVAVHRMFRAPMAP